MVLPIAILTLLIMLLGLTIYRKPWDSAISVGIMAAGIPAFIFGIKWTNKPSWLRTGLGMFIKPFINFPCKYAPTKNASPSTIT